jgi:hypothetical protein
VLFCDAVKPPESLHGKTPGFSFKNYPIIWQITAIDHENNQKQRILFLFLMTQDMVSKHTDFQSNFWWNLSHGTTHLLKKWFGACLELDVSKPSISTGDATATHLAVKSQSTDRADNWPSCRRPSGAWLSIRLMNWGHN